ncbi:MAG: YifB family Mg chelatase-like AAA ATPase [Candidatus Dojkabacteria bacterium]|nr:YifB family Mg chelatase-like AAA ATPase [Candidatus Dojkabacteria bacterium]
MLIKVLSAANIGLETIKVEVEVNMFSRGLPKFHIVGLPSKAVDESRQRVVTAIVNSGVSFPRKHIVVNLAPADIPKEGSCYDFPISAAILSSILSVPIPGDSLFFGELSLDGSLRHTRGVFLLALYAKEAGYRKLFVPDTCANEALTVPDMEVYPVATLRQLIDHLKGHSAIAPCDRRLVRKPSIERINEAIGFDIGDVIGNEFAKRAAEIVAAGGHNMLLSGPPGAGKTMIARSLPGIMPPLLDSEAMEVTKIYSATGNIPPNGSLIIDRPFRSPHHTTSTVGLIGGGSKPMPGEISLAHRGVLFLDEFAEFSQASIEALRQPLEDGMVTISRSKGRLTFPADFTLVASMNPCPCGFLGDKQRTCQCTPFSIDRYRRKISGPILDRIDMHVHVDTVPIAALSAARDRSRIESSRSIAHRVGKAREMQRARYIGTRINMNAEITSKSVFRLSRISSEARDTLLSGAEQFCLSARSYFNTAKVARTIADLDGSSIVKRPHVQEALQYRTRRYDGQ